MASAWGPHLQQVVGVPVSLFCDSGGEQKLCAVGCCSIHKLPRALPGCKVMSGLLGARRSTAGTVAPGTYFTCSSGRSGDGFLRGGACGSAPKQVVCPTYFTIGRLWLSGLCGCIAHVTFQDRLVGPLRVL